MNKEYYQNLSSYEDLDAHKRAILNRVNQKDAETLARAIKIVEKYHDTPRTLYTGNYNRHPVRVARILIEEFGVKNTNTLLIGLCHDLGEWTAYDIKDLETEFGLEVKTGVETLTWNQVDPWDIFFQKIVSTGNDDLIKIKMADKLDNNRAAAFSNEAEKKKARDKTEFVLRPLIEERFPEYWDTFKQSLRALA